MQQKTVVISPTPPRDIQQYRTAIDFLYGLRSGFIVAGLFLFIGVLSGLAFISTWYKTGKVYYYRPLVAAVTLVAAYRYVRLALDAKRKRLTAFERGILAKGVVVGHGRSLLHLQGGGDYYAAVQVTLEDGRILEKRLRSPSRKLHERHPLQSEINVLVDKESGAMFMPEEAGITAVFQ